MSAALMLVLAVTLGCLLPRDTGPRARVPYPALISSVLTLTVHDRVFRVRSMLGLLKTLLNRPGNKDLMLDLLYDYRTNLGLYPRWHEYFRARQPPTLITWGGNDEIFPEAGAHPDRSDLPRAEIVILDAGHFALEDHADVIAQHISRFTAPFALSGGSDAAAGPAASS